MKRLSGFAIVLVAIMALFAVAGCSQAGGSADNAITVSATGKASVVPDSASFSVLVDAEGETKDELSTNAERLTSDVIARLRTAGADTSKITKEESEIEEVYGSSSSSSGSGYYDWYGNWVDASSSSSSEEFDGYEMTTTLTVENINASELGKVLRECVAAGATGFEEFKFTVSDRDAAYQKALTAAVEAAHAKAEALADASKVFVGRVVNMTEDSDAASLDLTIEAEESSIDVEDTTTLDIVPSEISVEASVTVSYAIS